MTTARLVFCLAALKIALQLATAGQYGIFRDELYYIACAEHLDLGYVDHPPLVVWITWLVVHSLGTSLYALRLLPALAGGALVWATAGIAREMGGDRNAQLLAGAMVIPVPIYLLLDHWLTMNAVEPLLWTGLVWLVLRMTLRGDPRYWPAIGALCGIGLLNKYSMALPMAALFAVLLATKHRSLMVSRWFPLGVGLCALLVLPHLIWLIRHDFPFFEFEQHSRLSGSRIQRGPAAFIGDQMLMMNPLTAPLWIGGVVWLVRGRFRWLGGAWLGVFLLLLAIKAKNYYVSPLYPVAFAAGAIWLTRWRAAYAGAVMIAGAVLAPLVLPILPIPTFIAYREALGGLNPVRLENLPHDLLPQHFADEFGWEDMVAKVAQVFAALPEEERRDTAIFGNNYGEAAAIDFFGPKYGLPKAIGNHVTYWLWGPRDYSGKTMIVLGGNGSGEREHFHEVDAAGHLDGRKTRIEEHYDIYLCRDLNEPLAELWPKLRKW